MPPTRAPTSQPLLHRAARDRRCPAVKPHRQSACFSIEKKKPKLLNLFMRYGCATIVDKLLPRGDGIALLRLDLQQPTSNDFRKFESRYRRVAHARNTLQLFRIGADHRCKIAELIQ